MAHLEPTKYEVLESPVRIPGIAQKEIKKKATRPTQAGIHSRPKKSEKRAVETYTGTYLLIKIFD